MAIEGVATERRLTAVERREQILSAAAAVFGERGYTGTTTDQVARAAGISQPYVVRMFGSKETLFLEVLERARLALLEAFREVLERNRDAVPDDLQRLLGEAYVDLIRDRGIHMPLMQGFLQGVDPAIGAKARQGFLDIWRFVTEQAGFDDETARDFLAQGMLINVLLGLRMPRAAADDPVAARLLEAACGPKLAFVLEHGR